MKLSEKFEKQIARIHSLIEGGEAKVTWDDHIPDPDNPDQPRQIDITINYKNKLTIVECRIHKRPQGVQWIEELIGRRISLKADAIIAVSASGYTKGAILKAKTLGVILRDLQNLTEEEIKNWGRETLVTLSFIKFMDVEIEFSINKTIPNINSVRITDPDGKEINWRVFFQNIISDLEENKSDSKECKIKGKMEAGDIRLNGLIPVEVNFQVKTRPITQKVSLVSIVQYYDPIQKKPQDKVLIEKINIGDFEILQSGDQVSVVVDLSGIRIPKNSIFRTLNFDFKRNVTVKFWEFIGMKDALSHHNLVCFKTKMIGN